MKLFVRRDVYDEFIARRAVDEIEKSHKYIRRWKMNNGEWGYEYPSGYDKRIHSLKDVATGIAGKTKTITDVKPLRTEAEINTELKRLKDLADSGNLKCPALGNSNIYIEDMTAGHAEKTRGRLRTVEERIHKLQYLSFVEPVLKNGVLFMKSRKYNHSWTLDKVPERERTTYGIINKVSFHDDRKGKDVECGLEIVVAWDSERKRFVFSFIDRQIKKSLPYDRDLSATFWACQAGACKAEAFTAADCIIAHLID